MKSSIIAPPSARSALPGPGRPPAAALLLLLALLLTATPHNASASVILGSTSPGAVSVGDIVTVTYRMSDYTHQVGIDGYAFDVEFPAARLEYMPNSFMIDSAVDPQWLSRPLQETPAQGYSLSSSNSLDSPGLINIRIFDGVRLQPEEGTTADQGFLVSFRLRATSAGAALIRIVPPPSGFILLDTSLNPFDVNPDTQTITLSIADAPPVSLDFGDAPDPYPTTLAADGARHSSSPNFFLGFIPGDLESNGQPSAGADGDDLNPTPTSDDEDGISFPMGVTAGTVAQVQVRASSTGFLDAWIDFNGNGSWADVDDQIFTATPVSAGINNLTFSVPANAASVTYARFRLSAMGGLAPTGLAGQGEVEDYRIPITQLLFDFGDAPEQFPTLLSQEGARHRIVAGTHLGSLIDSEPDGQPDFLASLDDNNPLGAGDDEDGVTLPAVIVPGQIAGVIVVASTSGMLDAFIDFNGNLSWADPGEQIFANTPLVAGNNTLTFPVPSNASPGPAHARFRFSRAGNLSFDKAAPDGEVEDYLVTIEEEEEPCDRSNKGLDFWLTFPGNYAPDPDNPINLSLHIVGPRDTTGRVEIPGLGFSQNFIIPGSMSVLIALPTAADLGDSIDQIEQKGIHVTADNYVAVFGMNRVLFTTDGFLGLPSDVLTKEYIVQGFGNVHTGAPNLNGTQFAVVACEDNTVITITPSADAAGYAAGVPYDITLNSGETYQLRGTNDAPTDLSGTLLVGNKPFSAFGSHQCANIPDETVWFCDYIVEQLLPARRAGTEFVMEALATRSKDVYRFLAVQDNTSVTVNGINVATLNRGESHQMTQTGPVYATSDRPMLTTQYSASADADGQDISDPFMIVIPSTDMFLTQYMVCSPDSGYETNVINVVAPTSAVGSVLLDGMPINAALFSPIPGSGYSGAKVGVAPGVHNLAAVAGGASNLPQPFGVTVYGFAEYDSYGFPGGMYFTDKTPPTVHCPEDGTTIPINPSTCHAFLPDFTQQVMVTDNCPLGTAPVVVTQKPSPGTALPPGTHTVTLQATDRAGNAGTCEFTVVVVDEFTPSLQCPQPGIAVNSKDAQGAIVTFDIPAITPCGNTNFVVVCSPASGSHFPKGTTTVNCQTTTAAGQTASCTFTVTVRFLTISAGPTPGTVVINWAAGGQVQSAPSVLGPWLPATDVQPGTPLPTAGSTRFFRVDYGRTP